MDVLKDNKVSVALGAGLVATLVIFMIVNGIVASAGEQLAPISAAALNALELSAGKAPTQLHVAQLQAKQDSAFEQARDLHALLGDRTSGELTREQWDYAMERWLPSRTVNGPPLSPSSANFDTGFSGYVTDLKAHYRDNVARALPNSAWGATRQWQTDLDRGREIIDAALTAVDIVDPTERRIVRQKRYWILAELLNTLMEAVRLTRESYRARPDEPDSFKQQFIDSIAGPDAKGDPGAAAPGEMSLGPDAPEGGETVPAPRDLAEQLFNQIYVDPNDADSRDRLPICLLNKFGWSPRGDIGAADETRLVDYIAFEMEITVSGHVWPYLAELLAAPVIPPESLTHEDAAHRRPGIRFDLLAFEITAMPFEFGRTFSETQSPLREAYVRATNSELAEDEVPPPPPLLAFDENRPERRNVRIFNQFLAFMLQHVEPPPVYKITISGAALDFTAENVTRLEVPGAEEDAAPPPDGGAANNPAGNAGEAAPPAG